jgi:protein SCO1
VIEKDLRSPELHQRLVWAGLGIVLAGVMATGAWAYLRGGAAAGSRGRGAPEILGEIPDFTLTDASGAEVTRATLLGRIWVADFIFTRCTGVCPILSGRMASVEKLLGGRGREDVALVSISVDPDYDTPEVLRRYASAYGADPIRWRFLTGPRASVHRLVAEGFHLAVALSNPGEAAPGELVTHSDRLVLVDRLGRIRGYYHGTEDDVAGRLLADLDRVAREK